MAVSYEPIKAVRTLNGVGMPAMLRVEEGASKTFKLGVPLTLSSGQVQECAFGGSELVYGVSAEAASNLTAAGTSEPAYSEGAPINQASAKTIPVGARMRDGKCGLYLANGQTVFSAMLKDGQVFTQALISSTRYELEKDGTSGLWFIDPTNSGTNDEHAVNVVGVDPSSPNTAAGGARVFFIFNSSARYHV